MMTFKREPKDKLLSFKLRESDYVYVRSQAFERDMSISQFLRMAISLTRDATGGKEVTEKDVIEYIKKLHSRKAADKKVAETEVIEYLRKLAPSERLRVLDEV